MGSSVEQSPVANRRSKSPESKKTKDDLNKPKKRSRSRSPERRRTRRHKRSNSRQSDDEEYPRYYGDDNKNSDRYWNKYPKKDETRVGARYYDMEKEKEKDKEEDKTVIPPRQRKIVDLLTSKTGGAYIPPAKLRLMQKEITDKTSPAYQRIAWEALKKSIQGHVNKANTSNIKIISKEIFQENIIRGRGLLCKSIIKAQSESPTFTRIYAALIAIINSKFPNIGELLLKRLVLQFKRGYKQNNKTICITAVSFIAHLVNQQVAHEILALEILTLLVHTPTDDSVEVAISFLKESGQKLTEVSSKGISAIFEMLRNILHEGKLEKRIQYMIEVMFQIRKDGFKDHAAILEDHDIVKEDDQITHLITLDSVEQQNSEDTLNVFKFDDVYEQNEKKYETIVSSILESDDSGSESGSEGDDDDDDEDAAEETGDAPMVIVDKTETTLVALRRTIYLTIQSSLDFEECAHKLLKMELKPGQEVEFCHMFLDCCAEQRTYEKFYGLLAQRFCQINKIYVTPFEQIFKDTYATSHRLDTSRLRNVSKFFAHLLFTDSIGWEVMEVIQLTEETTTSSSRIFIKILFQELSEYMGLAKLNARLNDPTLQGHFSGLFPRDNPNNSRFSINFFTSSGLGGLTDGLREHLRALSKMPALQTVEDSSSSSSSSESSSSSDSSSSSSSSSSDSSSEEESGKKSKNFRKKDSKNQKKVVDAKRGKFGEDKFKSPRNDRDRRDLESDRMPNSSRRFERSRSTDRNDRQRDYKPREDRRNERDERRYDKQSRTDERRPERDERRPERDERRPERDERRPKRDESRTKRDVRDERSSGRDERRDGRDERRNGRDESRNGRDESRNGRDERERRRGRDERREKV